MTHALNQAQDEMEKRDFPCAWSFKFDHPIKSGFVWAEGVCGTRRQEWFADKSWHNECAENKDMFHSLFSKWCDKYYDEEYAKWPLKN